MSKESWDGVSFDDGGYNMLALCFLFFLIVGFVLFAGIVLSNMFVGVLRLSSSLRLTRRLFISYEII